MGGIKRRLSNLECILKDSKVYLDKIIKIEINNSNGRFYVMNEGINHSIDGFSTPEEAIEYIKKNYGHMLNPNIEYSAIIDDIGIIYEDEQ